VAASGVRSMKSPRVSMGGGGGAAAPEFDLLQRFEPAWPGVRLGLYSPRGCEFGVAMSWRRRDIGREGVRPALRGYMPDPFAPALVQKMLT
jgi:hypothetical protein